jgi:hypothetical protein
LKLSRIIFGYLVFALLIAIPPAVLIYLGETAYIITRFWLLFGYLSVFTLLVIVTVIVAGQKSSEFVAPAFLASTTVKILGTLFFVLIFLRKNHVNKFAFAADFFYVYFLNTAFEVYGLLRNLRNQNLR